MVELSQLSIGEDHPEVSLEASQDNYLAALTMFNQATHSIDIYSRYLDGKLFDTSEILGAIRQLVTQHSAPRVRILLKDIEPLIKYGHRLLETARHLSSYIEIRNVHKDYSHFNESFFIIDGRGVIHRKYADRYEGLAHFNNPKLALELTHFFNEVWEHSSQPPDSRRLSI